MTSEWTRTTDTYNNLIWVKQTPDDKLRMDFTLVADYLNALETRLAVAIQQRDDHLREVQHLGLENDRLRRELQSIKVHPGKDDKEAGHE